MEVESDDGDRGYLTFYDLRNSLRERQKPAKIEIVIQRCEVAIFISLQLETIGERIDFASVEEENLPSSEFELNLSFFSASNELGSFQASVELLGIKTIHHGNGHDKRCCVNVLRQQQ